MNARNSQLMVRFESHPEKAAMERALEVSERYAAASERIKANRDLSDIGRQKELTAQARLAVRDICDLRKPVDEMIQRRAALYGGVQKKQFDKSDIVAAMNRAELRNVVASLPHSERVQALFDPVFRDAILEQPALVSGFKGEAAVKLFEDARTAQMNELHGPRLREIEALDQHIEEATAVFDVVRNDLRTEMGASDHAFKEFWKQIEKRSNAPWLKRDRDGRGNEVIMCITPGKDSAAHVATPDEIRDGKYYANHAEYLTDRSAA